MNQNSYFPYQIGGSLANRSPSYVVRVADMELTRALSRGEFCYVLNSRQMGKSSLRVRAMEQLQAAGTICIAIDLTGMGTQDLTLEKWYAGILRTIVTACQLQFNWRNWWREKRDLFAPVQRLSLFIEEVLLVEIEDNIAIFVDEIDRVLSQKFSLDDFFGLIHSCYQKRQINKNYHRLTFTLLGVAAPRNLIRDRDTSPFELGKAIKLQGFSLTEANNLTLGLTGVISPQQTLAEILEWTGGQPFLTQKLCQLVAEAKNKLEPNLVSKIIDRHIIHNWEVQDEPEHLRTIRDRLCYRDSTKTIRLLGIYQDILAGKRIAVDNSSEQIELRLSGLVTEANGVLQVSNKIYARVFDLVWIEAQLSKLRPYSQALNQWLKSDRDSNYLLQRQELQDALTWSLNKSLADIDYQFLVASQDLAKQQAENALIAVETASNLLAIARKKARHKASKHKLGKRKLGAIALGVAVLTILLRYTGVLQSWELNLLDRFFRWRLTDKIEPRITVVTINERDLKHLGQYPIKPKTLAKAVINLQRQQPQAIGIDIFQDLPANGSQDLIDLFVVYPNLYIVEKAVGEKVLPPAISPQQIGFVDRVVDSDGKIRRALLSVVGDDGQTRLSLGTQLALNYLQQRNIQLQPLKGDLYQLGQAVFTRFQRHDGGYVRADSGGYQVLLNYWGTSANFQQYSLMEVLNNKIEPEHIRGRAIFIGTTAESIKDSFYTPYSESWFNSSPQKMPGVFLHANDASQTIGAAIDNRPLLRTTNKQIESFWILSWGIIGVVIVWRLTSIKAIAFTIGGAVLCLIILCFLMFITGWWLPGVAALVTLNLSILVAVIWGNRERDRVRFQQILNQLLAEPDPLIEKIALEYFKQSETKDYQTAIARVNIDKDTVS